MKKKYALSIIFSLFLLVPFHLASQITMSQEYFELHEQFRSIRIGNIFWIEPARPPSNIDCSKPGAKRTVNKATQFIDLKYPEIENKTIYILMKCEQQDNSVYSDSHKIYRVKDIIFNDMRKKLQDLWELSLTESGPVFGETNPNWDKVDAMHRQLDKIQIIPPKPKSFREQFLSRDLGLLWITAASEGGNLLFPTGQFGMLETSLFIGGNIDGGGNFFQLDPKEKRLLALALTLSVGYRNAEYTIPQGSQYTLLNGGFQTASSAINFCSDDLVIQSAFGVGASILRIDGILVTFPIRLGFRSDNPGIDYAKAISEGAAENDFSKIEFASRFVLQISPVYISITIPWGFSTDDSRTIRLAAGLSFRIPIPDKGD